MRLNGRSRALGAVLELVQMSQRRVASLLLLLFLRLDPVFELDVLLGQLVEQILVEQDHILRLRQVTLELVILQVPAVRLALSLPDLLFHLTPLVDVRSAAVLQRL